MHQTKNLVTLRSLSKLATFKKPSLCSYCLRSERGFLIKIDGKIYSSCSMEHIEKIKERIEQGDPIGIKASANPDGVDYALTEVKKDYLEMSKKNNSYVLHKWEQGDKKTFFLKFLAYYLSFETVLADEGMKDGHKKNLG